MKNINSSIHATIAWMGSYSYNIHNSFWRMYRDVMNDWRAIGEHINGEKLKT